jgi:hypothetical protein
LSPTLWQKATLSGKLSWRKYSTFVHYIAIISLNSSSSFLGNTYLLVHMPRPYFQYISPIKIEFCESRAVFFLDMIPDLWALVGTRSPTFSISML